MQVISCKGKVNVSDLGGSTLVCHLLVSTFRRLTLDLAKKFVTLILLELSILSQNFAILILLELSRLSQNFTTLTLFELFRLRQNFIILNFPN